MSKYEENPETVSTWFMNIPFYNPTNLFLDVESNKIDVLHIMTGYLFGAAASYSFVTISKFTIGRLRPHFLDVCRPNFEEIDCGTDTHPFFVTNYQCQGNIQLLQVCLFWAPFFYEQFMAMFKMIHDF